MKKLLAKVKQGLAVAWRYKVRTGVLLVILFLVAPKPVKSQFLDPCCAIMAAGLNTIGSTLSSVIGGGLGSILSIEQDISKFEQTISQYVAVYGSVPDAASASPQTRDLGDMTDAAAQAAMKRAIEIDALADLELQAADQINQSVETAAPGSAPIIEAQADAWLVRANAYTQAATADLMRVRAIDLADASANVKNGAANTAAVQQ